MKVYYFKGGFSSWHLYMKGWGRFLYHTQLVHLGWHFSSKIVHFYTNVATIVIDHLKSFSFVGKLTILIDWPLPSADCFATLHHSMQPLFLTNHIQFCDLIWKYEFYNQSLMLLNSFLNFNCIDVIHSWCFTTSPSNCISKEFSKCHFFKHI
jgi:hypothetical protein